MTYWGLLKQMAQKIKRKSKKVATPKWLKRPVKTTYLKLFRKHTKRAN